MGTNVRMKIVKQFIPTNGMSSDLHAAKGSGFAVILFLPDHSVTLSESFTANSLKLSSLMCNCFCVTVF